MVLKRNYCCCCPDYNGRGLPAPLQYYATIRVGRGVATLLTSDAYRNGYTLRRCAATSSTKPTGQAFFSSTQAIRRNSCFGLCQQTSQACAARLCTAGIQQQLGVVRQLQEVASGRTRAKGRQLVLQRQSGYEAQHMQRATGNDRRSDRL